MNFTDDFFTQAQASLERVVRANKAEVLKLYGNVETHYKADNSAVTDTDLRFEAELKKALNELDAGIGFEGEEYGVEGNRETFWLIDPIDGTEGFIRGMPYVRTMLTLIDNEAPIFAFIYNPVTDTLSVGKKGSGVTKNGQPVRVSQRPLDRVRIELDAYVDNPRTASVITALTPVIDKLMVINEFTYVVDGRLDAYLAVHSKGGPWDFAPRALLLEEAGAKVTNIGSDTYNYRDFDFLAANPQVFDKIMTTITHALGAMHER